jgi:hypothetical protein
MKIRSSLAMVTRSEEQVDLLDFVSHISEERGKRDLLLLAHDL